MFIVAALTTLSMPVLSAPPDTSFSGTWEQELAVANHDNEVQKFEALVEPEWSRALENGLELTAIGRVRLDLPGVLGPISSRPANYSRINGPWIQGTHGEISLREFYLDAEWLGSFWRIGKQQVVWGQADGLKVLDLINPQSFREFILDEFDDSRIPLWMVNLEVPVADTDTLQLLWIPDTTYHGLAETGTPYQITSPRLAPEAPVGIPVKLLNPRKPHRFMSDSDFGLRFASFRDGWDITLNYLYHYADLPVLYQDLDQDGVTLAAEYERSHLLGGTLSNAFGDFTIRAEVGYSTATFHVAKNVSTRGISSSPEMASVLGLDWQGLSDTFISVQWFQSRLFDYDTSTVRDRNEHTMSFLFQRYFASETWTLEVLVLQSINDHDSLVRPKLTHSLLSNLDIWVGADLFRGNKEGLFGQFDKTNRVTAGFRLGF